MEQEKREGKSGVLGGNRMQEEEKTELCGKGGVGVAGRLKF